MNAATHDAEHHVQTSSSDNNAPDELHPSFGNSFGWHSSVHIHWLLSSLLSSDEDASGARRAEALRVLEDHLSAENIKTEADYLRANPTWGLTPGSPIGPSACTKTTPPMWKSLRPPVVCSTMSPSCVPTSSPIPGTHTPNSVPPIVLVTYDNSLVLIDENSVMLGFDLAEPIDEELARPAGYFLTSEMRRRWNVVYKTT
ncbi:DUF2891 family protein [Corynebacterium striatum]